MKVRAIAFLACLLSLVTAYGQDPEPIETSDPPIKIEVGPQFVTVDADAVIIPAGETWQLSGGELIAEVGPILRTSDDLIIRGTLVVDRTGDFTFPVDTLIVDGGTFDCGTIDDPVTGSVVFEFTDEAVNADGTDPYEWGHGVISVGESTVLIHGKQVDTWWYGGDQIPEIVNLAGDIIREGVGYNTERNVVFRSKNPGSYSAEHGKNGGEIDGTQVRYVKTRGHFAITGMTTADIRYCSFIGMGRTTTDLTGDGDGVTPHPNQIGRYGGVHAHHAQLPGKIIGTFVDGVNYSTKWSHVIHAADFWEIKDNVATTTEGGHFTTEDGDEHGNVFDRNLAMDVKGLKTNAQFAAADPLIRAGKTRGGRPGAEGAAFWFQGNHNEVTRNYAWDVRVGFQNMHSKAVNFEPANARHPELLEELGVESFRSAVPIKWEDNVAHDCRIGFETWRAPGKLTHVRDVAFNPVRERYKAGLLMGGGTPGSIKMIDAYISGFGSGVASSNAYTSRVTLKGGVIENCIDGVKDAKRLQLYDVTLENQRNINFAQVPRYDFQADGVVFKDGCPGFEEHWTGREFRAPVYDPEGKFIPKGGRLGKWQDGTRFKFSNFNGTGKTYLAVSKRGLAHQLAQPGLPKEFSKDGAPCDGLTWGEVWDQFGVAHMGITATEEETVELSGFKWHRFLEAEEKLHPTLPKQAIMTFPRKDYVLNEEEPHIPLKSLNLSFSTSGRAYDPGRVEISIDGGQWRTLKNTNYVVKETKLPEALEPGVHKVETRLTIEGEPQEGSNRTFNYVIAGATRTVFDIFADLSEVFQRLSTAFQDFDPVEVGKIIAEMNALLVELTTAISEGRF